MDRCNKWIPSHKKTGTQCVLSKGHEESGKPEYAKCCADAATVLYRVNESKYLDVTAKP